MTLFQFIFFAFLVLYLFVTYYVSRKTTVGDFYNMNGDASAFLVAGTYTATLLSAIGLIGMTAIAYKTSFVAGLLHWSFFSYALAMLIGVKLRRFGQVTLGDFYGERFDSTFIRVLNSVVTVLALGAYFVTQIIGSAAITEAILGIPFNATVIIMVFVFTFIAIVGGTKSVTLTDTIMMVVIVVFLGYIFGPMVIAKVGLPALVTFAEQNPNHFTATGGGTYTWGYLVGAQALWTFGNACNPASVTRAYLAKDSRTWAKSMLITLAIVISFVWILYMAAVSIRAVKPDLPNNQVLTWAAMNLVNPVVGGIAISGLFAACLSTASTQILTLSLSIVRDIYEKIIMKDKPVEDRKLLFYSRLFILIFAVLGVLLSLGSSSMIMAIGNFGGVLFASAYFPPLFFGVVWRRFNRYGASASMIAGIVLTAFLYVLAVIEGMPFGTTTHLPFGIHPVLWALAGSLIVAVGVTLVTQPNAKELAVFDIITPPKGAKSAVAYKMSRASLVSSLKWYAVAVAAWFVGVMWVSSLMA